MTTDKLEEPIITNQKNKNMKKTTIAAADFQRKPYAQPQMKVVEIDQESLICQSPGASTQSLDEEDYEW